MTDSEFARRLLGNPNTTHPRRKKRDTTEELSRSQSEFRDQLFGHKPVKGRGRVQAGQTVIESVRTDADFRDVLEGRKRVLTGLERMQADSLANETLNVQTQRQLQELGRKTRKRRSGTLTESHRLGKLRLVELTESVEPQAVQGNVLRGVTLVGFQSKNRRFYPPGLLKRSAHLYEGATCYRGHSADLSEQPFTRRMLDDMIGVIRRPRYDPDRGIVGDVVLNPHLTGAKDVLRLARKSPGSIGMSHHIDGKISKDASGHALVESIARVRSVDICDRPATSDGLWD